MATPLASLEMMSVCEPGSLNVDSQHIHNKEDKLGMEKEESSTKYRTHFPSRINIHSSYQILCIQKKVIQNMHHTAFISVDEDER